MTGFISSSLSYRRGPGIDHVHTYISKCFPTSRTNQWNEHLHVEVLPPPTQLRGCVDSAKASSQLLHRNRGGSRVYSAKRSDICTMSSGDEVSVSESKMEPNSLMTPYKLGPFELSHRVVLAPLTRMRSYGSVPQPHAAVYYSQRTSPGGLLISEATCITDDSYGYPNTPGIHRREQIEAWKPIVQAVHEKGGIIFCQLWHVGRASHYEYQPNKAAPVSSSSKKIQGSKCFMKDYTFAEYATPRALRTDEVPKYVEAYRVAARNAREAGFDGVEIHAANGYLLEQFMKDGVNDRTDQYGSQSLENRCRFTFEVIDAVADEVGADRVGIRLSPFTTFNGIRTSDPTGLGLYLAQQLDKRVHQLVYLHFIEPRVDGVEDSSNVMDTQSSLPFRQAYSGTFIAAGGFTRESGIESVASGHADLIAYGRMFIGNPDLPRRFELTAPLNRYDRKTFYLPEPVLGYTDYPFLTDDQVKACERSLETKL